MNNKTADELFDNDDKVYHQQNKERIIHAYEELVNGVPTHIILEKFSTVYNVSERTVYRYIEYAKKLFKQYADKKADEVATENYNRLMELYRECKRQHLHRDATNILKEINKMYGIGNQQKLDITSGGEKIPVTINIIRKDKDADTTSDTN
jgi:hypothetical protein